MSKKPKTLKFPKAGKKAKKPAAKKPAAKKAPGAAHSAATTRVSKPRDKKLPGFDQPRNRRLEMLCESLDTQRSVMNDAKRVEKSDKAAALQEMTRVGLLSFKHSGIELARIPGADTIRVHVVKEDGEMSASGQDDGGDGGADGDDDADEGPSGDTLDVSGGGQGSEGADVEADENAE
ncbi:MAG: hypothetical protein ACYC2H_01515 [Thermoplasmatota archaeon]